MNIERIKALREDRDLKQVDLSNLLKTTQCQYSLYENGIRSIPIEKLDILADFYDTSIDYLVGRTDIRESYPESVINNKKKKNK